MDLETRLNLEADEGDVSTSLEEQGGRLDQDENQPGVYWITLHPRTARDETYYARIAWQSYPHEPPSVKFADGVRGSLSVTNAWPVIPGYRPSSFDICKPFTAEGFKLHPGWERGAERWPTDGNPFLWVVQVLQYDLDNHYGGRAK